MLREVSERRATPGRRETGRGSRAWSEPLPRDPPTLPPPTHTRPALVARLTLCARS